ncbi:MAG: hypothetical protein OEV08_05065 [Nitrospira sp.]|nr:hypothetical protein [Nitrospira sp.]
MVRKSDRFEQMVKRAALQATPDNVDNPNWVVDSVMSGIAVKLLRRYHAKVRQMVRLRKGIDKALCHNADFRDGYIAAAQDILKDLDALKKGR